MVLNPSQYSPQGLLPQFPGWQGAGSPQMSPGLFGQPGANGGAPPFGQESGQAGLNQQYPFGGQTNSFQPNPFAQPFTQNQFAQSPFATNPYLQSQLLQSSLALNPHLNSHAGHAGAHNPTQHIITALGQIAQQFSVHGAMTQQIGIALHQLAQQLAQNLQTQTYAGQTHAGAGQPFGFGGPFAGNPAGGGQYFGQNPFAGAQGGYGGFSPQAQAWGANRQQTIQ
jgi:hypothetical protein